MLNLISQPLADIVHPEMEYLLDAIATLGGRLDLENGPWLAGGALRRLIDGSAGTFDVDIFSNEALHGFEDSLPYSKKCELFTLQRSIPIQVTVKPHGKVFANVEELLMDFDFTVCMFATDGVTLVYHPSAMIDLCERRLRTLGEKEVKYAPMKTFHRFLRYCLYGFVPDHSAIATMDQEYSFTNMSYYSRIGREPHTKVLDDLNSRSFDNAMGLSQIGDIVCESVDDRCYFFIEGIPLPAEYGFIFFYSDLHRQGEICASMAPIWDQLGIVNGTKRLMRMVAVITPASLMRAIQEIGN